MTDQSALAESLQYLDDVDALKSTPAQSHRLGSLTLESHADQRWHSALTALVLGPRLADKATVDGAILFILLGLGYDGLWQSKLRARCRARLDPVLTPQSISLGSTLLSVYLDRHGAKRDHADYGLASIEQSDFLAECDKLKDVFRATRLHDDSRHENTAEHSFHVALHALLLEDFAKEPVDVFHVVRMLLVHDIVEIDAGDTPIHGAGDPREQAEKEQVAADRIFGLLPSAQRAELRALWTEFEANTTPEAQFAKSLDRVPPICANLANGGGTWVDYNVTYDQLVARVGQKMANGAPSIWRHLDARIRIFPWFAAQL